MRAGTELSCAAACGPARLSAHAALIGFAAQLADRGHARLRVSAATDLPGLLPANRVFGAVVLAADLRVPGLLGEGLRADDGEPEREGEKERDSHAAVPRGRGHGG